MNNLSYIIPSAGKSSRLFPISDGIPKVLIKINGVPIFHFFYQQALKVKADNIIIAINQEYYNQLQEFINNTYTNSEIPIYLTIVDEPSKGVLYSISKATNHPECKLQILIVLSDTLYNADLPLDEKSFVICESVEGNLNRWCLAETDEFNVIKSFWDKPEDNCPTNKALIGIYYLNKEWFNKSIINVFQLNIKHRNEFQISQALEFYKSDRDLHVVLSEPNAWKDTGTLENLKNTSINFFISRAFNNIKILDDKLIKETTEKIKLKNEYIWYTQIKNKSLIPAIYSYEENEKTSKIEMELCSLNDLGTIFNFCNAEPIFFEQTISYLLNHLKSNLYNIIYPNNLQSNINMLINKLVERTDNYNFSDEDVINLSSLINPLEKMCENGQFTHIHGDLILSNILFEPQRMLIKLIDARGDYGGNGIIGDLRYDLAKLLHSLNGKYETILHNLYTIKDNQIKFYMNNAKLKCFDSAIQKVFNFASLYNISPEELKIIEISLFYSMIPLHKDDPKRQKAFLLTARNLMKDLNETFNY